MPFFCTQFFIPVSNLSPSVHPNLVDCTYQNHSSNFENQIQYPQHLDLNLDLLYRHKLFESFNLENICTKIENKAVAVLVAGASISDWDKFLHGILPFGFLTHAKRFGNTVVQCYTIHALRSPDLEFQLVPKVSHVAMLALATSLCPNLCIWFPVLRVWGVH